MRNPKQLNALNATKSRFYMYVRTSHASITTTAIVSTALTVCRMVRIILTFPLLRSAVQSIL